MTIDSSLLDLLADPTDRLSLLLSPEAEALYNPRRRLRYRIDEGIPVLLATEALPIATDEHERLLGTAAEDSAAERPVSQFEGHATWYDAVMVDPSGRGGLADSGFDLLAELLGAGEGVALDIGCGTGRAAGVLRRLGYRPVGVDLARDQLRLAAERLPVVQGSAHALPILDAAVGVAYSTFTTASWGDLPRSMAEVARVLRPGGRYVNVGVHPCFNGGHSRLQEDGSVTVRKGYRQSGFLPPAHFSGRVRSRVGGWHWPLAELLNAAIGAGLRITRVLEGGTQPVPEVLAFAAERT